MFPKTETPGEHRLLMMTGALAVLGLLLLLSGCSTAAMKGTPFYSGEYGKRNGPAEQRLNMWPVCYYRDPALSVLWPIFELTDDHAAVRPLYSVYGLDREKREYNVLWPLSQFDLHEQQYHIFPVFWGKERLVVFPAYWHFGKPYDGRGTDSLFPLWINHHADASQRDLHLLWPVFRLKQERREQGWHVWPWVGSYVKGLDYYRFALWPLGHQWSKAGEGNYGSTVVPFYWHQQTTSGGQDRHDLWLAAGLAKASWGTNAGAHYVFPFYLRDPEQNMVLTPLCGWEHKQAGFFYPFTPLVGKRTDDYRGSWCFPFYWHERRVYTGEVTDNYLLLGGRHQAKQEQHQWFFPLYSYRDHGTPEVSTNRSYAVSGREICGFPYWWKADLCRMHPDYASRKGTNAPVVHDYERKHGCFPLYSYRTNGCPETGVSTVKSSILLGYDYRHEICPDTTTTGRTTNDYTRARLLWRLWHYERSNGDVSVDVFPTISYDHKTNGYVKTSFLWRFFRYERSADGSANLDLLYLPLQRQKQ